MRWPRRRSSRSAAQRDDVFTRDVGFGDLAYARLASHIADALTKSRERGRPVVASVTVALAAGIDPLSHVAAARTPGDHWSSFSQPARDDFALASIGRAASITASGADRFYRLARSSAAALEAGVADDLFEDQGAPPGSGMVWTGGFGFYSDEPFGDAWLGAAAAEFHLPAASISRIGGPSPAARLTLNVQVQPDDDTASLLAAVESLVERLELEDEPVLSDDGSLDDPRPSMVTSVAPPEHYEQAVSRATELIAQSEIEKIVLAREVVLQRPQEIDCLSALRLMAARFPACTNFAIGSQQQTFIGSSPELLIRREGRRASTMALAGSARRGADEQADRLLGENLLKSEKDNQEHEIVVRQIERALGGVSAWIASGESPELVKVKNVQHLATPIRAQLTEPRPAIELAGRLHPTPAVGGSPWPEVGQKILELEGFDRGWYAGGVGWMDQLEDGEFHVALRSALVRGNQARLFVGAGVVGSSIPADELAETETKLEAMLQILDRR